MVRLVVIFVLQLANIVKSLDTDKEEHKALIHTAIQILRAVPEGARRYDNGL